MAWLNDNGYVPIPLGKYLSQQNEHSTPQPQRPIILTFDDVYANINKACEIMQEFGYTGSCFPISRYVDRYNNWDYQFFGRRLKHAGWAALRELRDCGWEIGSHSHRHGDLSQLAPQSLREELYASRSILQDTLGCEVNAISYPFGRTNDRICRTAYECGFQFGVGLGLSIKSYIRLGNMCLPRLGVYRCDSLKTFAQKVHSFSPIRQKMFNRQRLLSFCSQGTVLLKKWRHQKSS